MVKLDIYELKVEVDDEEVRFFMGIGLINKQIPLKNIKSCRAITNSWVFGWGIRIWFSFTLYNVSGFQSVELELYDKKRKIRIGTHEPEALCKEINKRLGPEKLTKEF